MPPPVRPFEDEAGADPGKLRIAFHPHPGFEADEIAVANRAAVLDTAKLLSEMGHELVEAAPPSFDGVFLAQSALIFAGNFAAA